MNIPTNEETKGDKVRLNEKKRKILVDYSQKMWTS